MDTKRLLAGLIALLLAWGCLPLASGAQEPTLAEQQQQVAERYRRLEELLLRLADVEADENAERAALLRRAAKQSRDLFVLDRLSTASQSLRSEQFKNAIDNQSAAKDGLDRMLTLLLSEDRPQRIRDEKERVGKMIKELKLVERLQKSTRARTENGIEFEAIGEEQQQIGDRAEKVRQSLQEDEEQADGEQADGEQADGELQPPADSKQQPSDAKPGETQPGEQEPGEQKPGEQEPGEQKPGEQKPGEQKPGEQETGEQKPGEQKPGEQKPGEQKPGEQKPGEQKPGEQKPGEQKPGEQKPGEQQPGEQKSGEQKPGEPSQPGESQQPADQSQQQPQSPEQQAQEQLQEAIEKMRQAEQELEHSKRDAAVEKQQQAEENLRAAIDRLEKILRQLREEEMQRELARLESRLRKMAQMQAKVLDETKLLDAIPVSQRDRQVDLRAGNLAFEEKKIVMEADRAMLLLREEGSSVAFPEVVSQIRGDMQRVAERLTVSKIDVVTIGLQDDILAALEEMIAALQKAQRDLEKQRQQEQQPQQQPGQPSGEQPLVEQLAELRLIRTMETRIMSTTERYARLADQSDDVGDVLPLIRDLAERQSNLYRITRDIVQERNQ